MSRDSDYAEALTSDYLKQPEFLKLAVSGPRMLIVEGLHDCEFYRKVFKLKVGEIRQGLRKGPNDGQKQRVINDMVDWSQKPKKERNGSVVGIVDWDDPPNEIPKLKNLFRTDYRDLEATIFAIDTRKKFLDLALKNFCPSSDITTDSMYIAIVKVCSQLGLLRLVNDAKGGLGAPINDFLKYRSGATPTWLQLRKSCSSIVSDFDMNDCLSDLSLFSGVEIDIERLFNKYKSRKESIYEFTDDLDEASLLAIRGHDIGWVMIHLLRFCGMSDAIDVRSIEDILRSDDVRGKYFEKSELFRNVSQAFGNDR